MEPDEARQYLNSWHERVSDDQVAGMSDEEAVRVAEQHWAANVGIPLPD